MNKQKLAVIEEIFGEFVRSSLARGHTQEKTMEVWELVTGFAGCAFCKAHSTAYGVEAYQSAWLKRYFPAEFMAGVLTNGKGFYHPHAHDNKGLVLSFNQCRRGAFHVRNLGILNQRLHWAVHDRQADSAVFCEINWWFTFQWHIKGLFC